MIPTADESAPMEPTPVQLARMEGTLNLIRFEVAAITPRINDHEKRIGVIELSVQRLGDAAVADKLTVEQTARALKDAKEATEAQARSELQKSDQAWTPINRLLAAISVLSGVVAFYFAIRPNG